MLAAVLRQQQTPKTMSLAVALCNAFKPNLRIFRAPIHEGQKKRGVEKAPDVLIDQCRLVPSIATSGVFCDIEVHDVTAPVYDLKATILNNTGGDDVVLAIGGDHLMEYYSIAAQLERFGNESLGVIWVDTHTDINTKTTSASGSQHGMVVAGLLGLEIGLLGNDPPSVTLLPKNIVYVGTRDIDEPEKEIVQALGIKVYTTNDIHTFGVKAIMEKVLYEDLAGVNKLHMSFDVDVIDPLSFPCTGTPVDGGITVDQSMEIASTIRDDMRLVSMGVVEFNPDIFPDMAQNCARIVNDMILTALTYK